MNNPTFAQLEREAIAKARSQRAVTPNIYVQNGGATRLSEARSVADALEANPETYGEFRDRHNAQALVTQLQRAGVRLQFGS